MAMKYFDNDAGFRGFVALLTNDSGTQFWKWRNVSGSLTLTRNSGSGDVDVLSQTGGQFYALNGLATDGGLAVLITTGYSIINNQLYVGKHLGINDGGFSYGFVYKGLSATDRAKFYASQQLDVTVEATGTGGRSYSLRTGNNASGINGALMIYDLTASAARLTFDSSGNATFGGTVSPVIAADPTTAMQVTTKQYVDAAIAGVGAGVPAADIQIFTVAGANTWTKPVVGTPKYVYVRLIACGGGGGSGRKGAAGTSRSGGSGGGSGGTSDGWFPAAALGATETVTNGTPGAGGNSISANSTDGFNATQSTPSTFGQWLQANHGVRGAAGSTGNPTGGAAGVGLYSDGTAGGNSTVGSAGFPGVEARYSAGSGGGGGPMGATNVPLNGGIGGSGGGTFYPGALAGGSAGVAGGAAAGAGTAAPTDSGIGAAGGGGGASNHTGAAGAGANGGYPGGGGGGGGSSTDSVGNSGAGGTAGGAFAIVVTHF